VLAAFQAASQLGAGDDAEENEHSEMMAMMMQYMPLRALQAFSGGAISGESLDKLVAELNEL
jgi:beta-glucosidase